MGQPNEKRLRKPANGIRDLYSRRWFYSVGAIMLRTFPDSLIHSPTQTSPTVHEPSLLQGLSLREVLEASYSEHRR